MLGKLKCKLLKQIRQRIADENDIPYVTRECTYQGSCKGTCPQCESELRYLEQQLAARKAMGKQIRVSALCAGLVPGASGSAPNTPESAPVPFEILSGTMPIDGPDAADDGILRPEDDRCSPDEPLVLGMMKGPDDWFTPGPGIGFETDGEPPLAGVPECPDDWFTPVPGLGFEADDDTLRAPEEHRD